MQAETPPPPASSPPRVSLTMAGLLMLGIAFGQIVPWAGYGPLALLAAAGWIVVAIKGHRFGMTLGMVTVPFLAGAVLITISGGSPVAPKVEAASGISLSGEVVMAEVMTKSRQRIRLRGAEGQGGDLRLITSRHAPVVEPGDVITGRARLQPPLPQLIPGGFDFTAHAHRHGYVATGFIDDIKLTGRSRPSLVARLRYGVQTRLYHHLDDGPAAIASAVLVGLRGGITPELREAFRGSGLAHLLAISGLHMALFWGSVVAAFRAGLALMPSFSSRHSSLKLATMAAAPFGLFYLVLSGMPISAIRAFLMLALVMVAILLTRRGFTLHHVALVAMGILVISPESLFLPAFQMSFAAVFALVAGWMAIIRSGWTSSRVPRLLRYLGGIMMGSVLASFASAPFVIHHFGVTTMWSVLANILGIPLMGMVIIPFGALALVVMPLGLEGVPLAVMAWGLEGVITASEYFSTLPLSRLALPPPSGLVLILMTAAMITLVVGRPWAWRYRATVPAACLVLAGVIWAVTPLPFVAMTALHGRVVAAITLPSGEVVFSRKSLDPFTRNILTRPLGKADGVYIGDVDCTECGRGWSIITAEGGIKVAVVWRRHGLTTACGKSDLVLSLVAADYPCRRGAPIIDRDDIARKGGVTITNDNGEIRITHVDNRASYDKRISHDNRASYVTAGGARSSSLPSKGGQ
ncbi:MAG: ComEC/Rec2 family competence protein [Alphaproteobacteria bacterium]|nr:ComEC/Rec2 family competence protein [Alphaproteobacteria bacterium]